MAKGTDSEEFVLMSESPGSASGLKRDLGVVAVDQTSSFSRFRSSNGILEYTRKRFKKSGGTNVGQSLSKEVSLSDQQKNESSTKPSAEKESATGSLGEQEQNNAPLEEAPRGNSVNKEISVIEEESDIKKNSLNVPVQEELGNNVVCPMSVENEPVASPSTKEPKRNVARKVGKETRSRRVTRSAVKPDELPLVSHAGNDIKSTSDNDQSYPEIVVCLRSANAIECSPSTIDKNSNAIVERENNAFNVLIEEEARNNVVGPLSVEVVDDNSSNANGTSFREIVLCLKSQNANREAGVLRKSSSQKSLNRFAQSTLKRKAKSTLSKSRKIHSGSKLKFRTPLCANEETHIATVKNGTGSDSEHGVGSDVEHDTEMLLVNGNNGSRKAFRVGCSNNNGFSKEAGTDVETPMVTRENSEVCDALPIKTLRRFTRSALTVTEQTTRNDGKVDKIMVTVNEGLQNTSPDKSTSTALETKAEPMAIAASVKPLRRFTRSALECTTEPRLRDDVQNTLLETPLRQLSRSAPDSKKEHQDNDEDSKLQSTVREKLLRRFTRSALRSQDEPMGLSETTTSRGRSPTRTSDVIVPVKTPRRKNLEMKMSKKIALTKFPTKINELLETGMLEGLSVTYKLQSQQIGVLQGKIKDCGILCSCTLCKGSIVVTPNQFERHAGSSNRKPAYYMYLDNGNSLQDVLSACKDAPLDILEAAIQTAITSPFLKNANCLNCKGPLPVLKTRRTLVLCDSCLEPKNPQTSPCTFDTVARSNRSRTPKTPDEESKLTSPLNKSSRGKLTRKDLGLHKLVFEKDGLPDGTELAYYVKGQKLLEGYKKGFGIFCFCCNSEISPSQFEAHAGWATRRKPYLHIYTSNGVSLHELSVSLSKGRKFSAKDNDDLCGICADFGDLLLCDGCPRAFHKDCVGLLSVPRGKWYCPYCQNVHRDQSFAYNANALAAGRVSGVDPIEQISKRCFRIIKTPEIEVGGCTLCRIPGFTKSRFGPRTIILCDQCEKEFHVGCLRDHNMADLKELPKGKWFCSRECSRINTALQKCICRGPEKLPESMKNLIKMKREETDGNLDISWRLLNGKTASPDSRSLLSKAVAIFHNRFDPIVDALTGRDLIPCMVYGRTIRDQDFAGMCCAVLTVNSAVVSVGLVRIFGQELAELPLVATSSDYQGQGYFQSLFECIERLLGFLNVKNLVLPAAEEAEAIWTQKFGFQKMSRDQLTEYTKDHQMTVFSGTPVLYKAVPKCRIIKKPMENNNNNN